MSKDSKPSKDGKKGSGNTVREQIPPIYKVVSGGVTIDFTDKRYEAETVFKEAYAKPKYIFAVNGNAVDCVAAAY